MLQVLIMIPKRRNRYSFLNRHKIKCIGLHHKHTAAEVIFQRADADKENMGLTSWKGEQIKKSDSEVAKNYLDDSELLATNGMLVKRPLVVSNEMVLVGFKEAEWTEKLL